MMFFMQIDAGEGYRGDGTTAYSTMDVDLLSNGFKFRNYPSENNKGTKKYIYMAFAEKPPTVPEKSSMKFQVNQDIL